MAIPTKDAPLAAWSTNFDTRITATPATFALTSGQASAYTPLHEAFISALAAVNTIGARSKSLVTAKDSAKDSLLTYARELYAVVQISPTVSDADKDLVNVKVKKTTRTPIGPPTVTPTVEVVERFGSVVRIRIHDGSGTTRARPAGVSGASVFAHVGPAAPVELSDWQFQGNTSKLITNVGFDVTLPIGTVVWFTSFFYNEKGQSGPGSAPVSTFLVGGAMQQAG